MAAFSAGSAGAVPAPGSAAAAASAQESVLVTGASGRTGQLVFEALLNDPRFAPKALVRSERSAKQLRKSVPGTGLDQIIICDVTSDLKRNTSTKTTSDTASTASSSQTAKSAASTASTSTSAPPLSELEACSSMVICTSAVPRISKLSLLQAVLRAPVNVLRGRKFMDFRTLRFVWKNGGYPEQVDYHGAVAQIDLARQLRMKQIVVVSSMGGTDPSNFLNSVGKNSKTGTGHGDILLWKRKAERYLVEQAAATPGLDYAIIHPGGLVDSPAGVEDFVLDVDDKLMQKKKRSICREDVAKLCVAALVHGKGQQVSLDCITVAVEDGNKPRTADEALTTFLQEQKTYNYAL